MKAQYRNKIKESYSRVTVTSSLE